MSVVKLLVECDDMGAINVDAALCRAATELRELARTAPPDIARQLLEQACRLEALVQSRKEP
jgi:hypothetical protein